MQWVTTVPVVVMLISNKGYVRLVRCPSDRIVHNLRDNFFSINFKLINIL